MHVCVLAVVLRYVSPPHCCLLLQGPVWQQLEEVCGNSPACVRVRLQRENKREDARNASLLSEVARLQLEVQQLQQQLADRDAQLAARNAQPQLQQELAELRV